MNEQTETTAKKSQALDEICKLTQTKVSRTTIDMLGMYTDFRTSPGLSHPVRLHNLLLKYNNNKRQIIDRHNRKLKSLGNPTDLELINKKIRVQYLCTKAICLFNAKTLVELHNMIAPWERDSALVKEKIEDVQRMKEQFSEEVRELVGEAFYKKLNIHCCKK